MSYVSKDVNLHTLINSDIVGAAHKSDAIRYFLIKTYGGYWIDISTFLLSSFDTLFINDEEMDNNVFMCNYAPVSDVEKWLIRSLSDAYEHTPIDKMMNFKEKEEKYIDLKSEYKKFDFISENYFIATLKEHVIINETYSMII